MDGETLGRRVKDASLLQFTKLIMLTSVGNRGDAKWFREIGFSAYLVKPLSQSTLLDTLLSLNVEADHSTFLTKHTLKEVRREAFSQDRLQAITVNNERTIRVLLAEDNIVNQKVATLMIKKLNITVDVAANGKEAVQMYEQMPYDLILMDCQMPEMDGFEATAKIRQCEHEKGKGRIPIIALTANALKGDEETCLASDMDDYLSKPINASRLKEMFQKWTQRIP